MAKSKVPTLDDIVDKIFNGKDLSKMEKQAVQSNVKPYNQKAIEQEIKNRLVKVQTTGSVKDVESILSNFSTHLKNFSSSANVAINNNTFTQELNDVREAMFKNALAEKTVGDWTELAAKETKSTHLNSSSALPGFEEKWAEKLRQVESPEVLDAVLNHSADKDQILSGLEEAQRKGKTTGIDFGDNVNKKLMQNRIEKLKKNPTLLTSNTDITEWRALREAAKVSNDTNLTKLASEVPNNTILTSLDETLDKEVIEELADRQDFAQTSKKLSKGAKDVFDKKIASGAGIADEAKLNYALDNNLLTDDQINKLGNEDLSKMQDQSLKNKLQTRVDAYDDQILKTKGFDPETNPRLKKRFETPSAQGGFTANQRADYINNAKEGTFYESTTGKFTEAGEKLTQQEKAAYAGRVGNKKLQWNVKHPTLASLENGEWARKTGDWVNSKIKASPKITGFGGSSIPGMVTGLALGNLADSVVPDRPKDSGLLTNAVADSFFGPTGTVWSTGPLEAMKAFTENNAAAKAAGSGLMSRIVSNPLAATGGFFKGMFNARQLAANSLASLYSGAMPEGRLDPIDGALTGLAGGLAAGGVGGGLIGAIGNAAAYAGGQKIQDALAGDEFRDATALKGNVQDITGDAFEQYNKGYYWNGKVNNRDVIWNTAELKRYMDSVYPNMTAAEREDWIDRHFTAWNPVQMQHLKYRPDPDRYDTEIRNKNNQEIGVLDRIAKVADANFNAYLDSFKAFPTAMATRFLGTEDDNMLYTNDGRVKSDKEAKQLLKTFIEGERSKQRANLKLGTTNDKNEDAARVVGMAGLDPKIAQQLVQAQVGKNYLSQGQGDELLQTINAMQQYLQANPDSRPVDYFNSL